MLLDEAIYTTGLLQDIAASASELFFVTPTTRSELARYTAPFEEPGFAHDIVQLGDLLQRIRMDARVSALDLQELVQLRRVIFEDLWGRFSRLRKEIVRYVVPLPFSIEDAVRWANDMLERIGFPNVWRVESRCLKVARTATDVASGAVEPKWNVLVDPQLLKQVLRNIYYNARHTFRDHSLPTGKSWRDMVALTIEIESRSAIREVGSLGYIVIRAKSLGLAPLEAVLEKAATTSTLAYSQHRLQIEEFGGSLSLRPGENEGGLSLSLP